jgi:uncharacterized protein YybS (DUF2232 family)
LEREKTILPRYGIIRAVIVLSLTLLAVALIPFVGPIVILMTPLPVLYYSFHLGRVPGLTALITALLVASIALSLLGRPVDLSVLMVIAVAGVMLAELLRRKYSIEKTLALASLALFFSLIAFVAYFAMKAGVDPLQIVTLHISGIIEENLKLYAQLNISEDQLTLIKENAPEIAQFFTGIFPALALSGAIFTVWLNVLAGRFLLMGKAAEFPDFGDLALWKASEKLVWLLIAAGMMTLLPGAIPETIGINILIVCCLLYLFQGFSIASFFFRHKQVPLFFRWLFYTLIVVQQYMAILVIAFGLFDIWLDFRKKITGVTDVHA